MIDPAPSPNPLPTTEADIWKGAAIGHQISIAMFDRDRLGREVRDAWVKWAETQPNPKESWLLPYDDLSEPDKEADRQIGEHIAGYVDFLRTGRLQTMRKG